jgi:hypothetical protein
MHLAAKCGHVRLADVKLYIIMYIVDPINLWAKSVIMYCTAAGVGNELTYLTY